MDDFTVTSLPKEAVAASPALSELAGRAGEVRFKLVGIKADEGSRKAIAKRAHDVTSALRSLRFLADALGEGYRFDDAAAADKIVYVQKAVSVLEREEKLLRNLFEG